jgi:hypothetical protein
MSKVINKGDEQLYNQIFCSFLSNNSGYNKCQNCMFKYTKPFSSINLSSENSCETNCTNNPTCVAYTYNIKSGNCDSFNAYPNVIDYDNATDINSGYSLKGSYDFNDLDEEQQSNIQVKCADQFLNDKYIKNNNIELKNCLKIDNSGYGTLFKIDPTCLYNIYNDNNLNVNEVNTASYIPGSINKSTISDPIIDNYLSRYNAFNVASVQNININNKLNQNSGSNNSNSLLYKYIPTVKKSGAPLEKSLLQINKSLGIEKFENEHMINQFKIIPILLIIFIIFIILFYVFKKK